MGSIQDKLGAPFGSVNLLSSFRIGNCACVCVSIVQYQYYLMYNVCVRNMYMNLLCLNLNVTYLCMLQDIHPGARWCDQKTRDCWWRWRERGEREGETWTSKNVVGTGVFVRMLFVSSCSCCSKAKHRNWTPCWLAWKPKTCQWYNCYCTEKRMWMVRRQKGCIVIEGFVPRLPAFQKSSSSFFSDLQHVIRADTWYLVQDPRMRPCKTALCLIQHYILENNGLSRDLLGAK